MNLQNTARNVQNSYIPSIQWAMNVLQNSKPIQQGIQGVQNGIQGFQNPQAPSGNVAQRALDQVPYLKNIRGFNEGMFGQQAVNNPQVSWGGHTSFKGPKLPMRGSSEQLLEAKSGWQPGMRRQFDTAMVTKDAATVRQLLPQVPKEYAAKFTNAISNVLQGKDMYTKPVVNDLLAKVMNPVKQSSEATAAKQFGQTLQLHAQNAKNIEFVRQLSKSRQIDQGLNTNLLPKTSDFTPVIDNARRLLRDKPQLLERRVKSTQTGLSNTTYYHTTSKEAAESIRQQGFKAQVGERSLGATKGKGVFLYKNDVGAAKEFSKNFTRQGKASEILETKVEGKIFNALRDEDRSIRALAEDTNLIKRLKSEGYVGIEGNELGTPVTFIFEPKSIRVAQQPKLVRK